jgi:hypothetical protein
MTTQEREEIREKLSKIDFYRITSDEIITKFLDLMEEREKELLKKVDDEFHYYSDGCGCCSETTVGKELPKLFNYAK